MSDSPLRAAHMHHLHSDDAAFIVVEGNIGCLRGDTAIYDPVDGSALTIAECWKRGAPFNVITMGDDGLPRVGWADPPVKRDKAQFYRVVIGESEFFVTGKHQFLCADGWQPLDAVKALEEPIVYGAPPQSVPQSKAVASSSVTPLLNVPLKVTLVEEANKGPYFDFHVPMTNCYWIDGVWHHNSGKSEFSHMLSRLRDVTDGHCDVLFEPIGSSRFRRLLGLYYQDPKRWGFTFQMHALQARFKQHSLAAELVANGRSVIQDRSIYADGCFGMTVHEDGNMTDDEWGIYADTFGAMKRFLRYPDVMVYLRTEPEVCHDRMKRRARSEEAGVPLDYLKRIHEKHEILVDEMSRYTCVLAIDWNQFGGDIEDINQQVNEIAREERKFMRDWRRL